MALLDLPTYKALLGVAPTNTVNDPQISALLEPASKSVESYTGRSFEVSANTSSARQFSYDGSGYLDIDDCTAVSTVQVNFPNVAPYVMDSNEWTAMPADGSATFYYLILHGGVMPFGISPEMGFERNLDQYPELRFKPPVIQVTATWGWPEVPEDVKLAAAFVIHDIVTQPSSEQLASEAIAGYSRSWGARSGATQLLAIPNRARDILANYQRQFV